MSDTSSTFVDSYFVQSDYLRFNAKLDEIVNDLIRHGFGEVTIRISVHKENKRTIVIEFGKSYQYTFHLAETRN